MGVLFECILAANNGSYLDTFNHKCCERVGGRHLHKKIQTRGVRKCPNKKYKKTSKRTKSHKNKQKMRFYV